MLDLIFKKADVSRQEYTSIPEVKTIAWIRFLVMIAILSCFTWFNAARAVVGGVALCFLILPQTRSKLFTYRGSKIIACFIAYSAVVAVIYQNWMGFLASLMFMGMVVVANSARYYMSRPFYEGMLDTMCLGSLFPSIWCIIDKYIVHAGDKYHRAQALFNNPNFYGATIVLVIVVCAYKVVQNGKRSWPYLGVAIINALGLLTCKSMSLWVVLFIAVFMLLFLCKRYDLLVLWSICGAVILALIYFFPEFFDRLTSDSIESTTKNRILIWQFANEKFLTAPIFGRGFFSYLHLWTQEHMSRPIFFAALSHNILLDSLLCHGVAGTLIGASFFTQYVRDLFKFRLRLRKNSRRAPISAMILSLFIALFFYGMIDTTLVWIQGGTILLLILTGIEAERIKGDHLIKT